MGIKFLWILLGFLSMMIFESFIYRTVFNYLFKKFSNLYMRVSVGRVVASAREKGAEGHE